LKILVRILGVLAFIRLLIVPITSRMVIGMAAQVAAFGAVVLYAILFNKFSKKMHVIICIGFLIPIIFAGFLAIYGNTSTVAFDEDVVIVLGAGVIGERVSNPLALRLDTAIYYFERNPNAYIIVCGGLGNTATITEAEAMARYLHERGIPRERILLEEKSTTTFENLTFALEILDEHFPDGFSAVVISNDFHMFRAVSMARRIGINANHLGAPTPTLLLAENYLREMMANIHFWIFG